MASCRVCGVTLELGYQKRRRGMRCKECGKGYDRARYEALNRKPWFQKRYEDASVPDPSLGVADICPDCRQKLTFAMFGGKIYEVCENVSCGLYYVVINPTERQARAKHIREARAS